MPPTPSPDSDQIVVAQPTRVNGLDLPLGHVVGAMTGGKPQPTKEAAETYGLTPGHIAPRLRDRTLARLGDLPTKAKKTDAKADANPHDAGEPPEYQQMKVDDLLAEINRRREAGRNVLPETNRKRDLIAALEADDEQADAEADADANPHDPED
jgi:hypothetical protein